MAGRVTFEISLSPEVNRTGSVWHVRLPALDPTLLYGAWARMIEDYDAASYKMLLKIFLLQMLWHA